MKILLIMPSFRKTVYKESKIKIAVPHSPPLSLATLAASLLQNLHEVKILDMNYSTEESLLYELEKFSPAYVGISFTTPLFYEMVKICKIIKNYNKSIKIVVGGSHTSSMPEETLSNSLADIAVIGEGEQTIIEIVNGRKLEEIPGIAYKKDGNKIYRTVQRINVETLDLLPFPAWGLFDLSKYKSSKIISRKSPIGWIETSRGCPFNCCYCNKSVFGRSFRVKSVKRVVDEIEYMLKVGFKEIHIADDMFTTYVDRVKEICREIINRKLKFPWSTTTGIRVDRGDKEMFKLMSLAGCYRVYFGIESGNQYILENIGKKITLQQVKKAVKFAKDAGMEVCGFFMLALPGETEQTMRDTINFACELDLDYAKTTITVPLPGTTLFTTLEQSNKIKTKDWSKYNLYIPTNQLYEHPNLEWKVINKYFNLFYRKFYWRPKYILKRVIKGIINNTLFYDIFYFLKTKW